MKTKTKQEQEPKYELAPLTAPNPERHKRVLEQMDCVFAHNDGKGGSGWIIVEDLGDEMVRVALAGSECVQHFYVAWSGMLRPVMVKSLKDEKVLVKQLIAKELMPLVRQVRSDLDEGRSYCQSPRIFDAKTHREKLYQLESAPKPRRKAA